MSWYFDLHPRTNPFAGALVDRLDPASGGLQKAEYRGEANGAGVGIIGLRGDGAYGQLIDPQGLQYIKVRRTDTLAVDGGFFLEKGDFDALTEKRTRYLEFSGAGPLSYLDREVMWRYTYETWGNDPEEGGVDTWQLHSQSTIFAGGDYLGAVLWRVLHEALGYVNAPGYVARTPHEDDKLETAIPGVTLTFDGFEDSSGNAWTLPSGEFTARVGESVYAVVQRLMRAGLYVEMDPDTGAVSAWEAAGHRRSRTGGAYGADVVRFVGGENIKSETSRAIAAFIKRTAVLAFGQNMGSVATGAGDVPWHGAVYSDAQDDAALEQLAASEIAHRADVGDVLRLKMSTGSTPLTGRYMPFEHVLLDDVVSVHTGSTQWDHNEATYPVAALEIKLRPAGDWDAYAHLGAVFMDAASRAFQAAGAPHLSPQTVLPCLATTAPGAPTPATVLFTRHWDYEGDGSGTLNSTDGDYPWGDALDGGTQFAFSTHYGRSTGSSSSADTGYIAIGAGQSVRLQGAVARDWFTDTFATKAYYVDWYSAIGGSFLLSTTVLTPAPCSRNVPALFDFTTPAPSGANYFQVRMEEIAVQDNMTVSVLADDATSGTGGTIRGGHVDMVGTSTRYARCGHKHHVFRDVSPTADDDAAHGYPQGTAWLVVDDVNAPTTVIARYLSLQDGTGAALWHQDYPTTGSVDASDVEYDNSGSGLASANVQAAIDELAAAGGGGTGTGWTLGINESGASFASFTAASGTWASDGTIITQSELTKTQRRVRHNTKIPLAGNPIVEAEIRFPSAGQSAGAIRRGGLLIGYDGAGGAESLVAYLEEDADMVRTEREGAAAGRSMAATLAVDTWYKLRFMYAGYASIYLDGTLLGNWVPATQETTPDYVGLYTYGAKVDFRNLKVWTITQPS